MRRYTEKKIAKMSVDEILELSEKGKCQLDEKRLIIEETYDNNISVLGDYHLYVVKFCYTLTFPETTFFEKEVYRVSFEDYVSFEHKSEAEYYMSIVSRPSHYIDYNDYQIFVKKEYECQINNTLSGNWYIQVRLTKSGNERRKVIASGVFDMTLYQCGSYITSEKTIEKLIYRLNAEYGAPKSTKSLIEVVEKQYNEVNFDELIKDVELLKNEKNKYITDEIERSTQYILTLKKLL